MQFRQAYFLRLKSGWFVYGLLLFPWIPRNLKFAVYVGRREVVCTVQDGWMYVGRALRHEGTNHHHHTETLPPFRVPSSIPSLPQPPTPSALQLQRHLTQMTQQPTFSPLLSVVESKPQTHEPRHEIWQLINSPRFTIRSLLGLTAPDEKGKKNGLSCIISSFFRYKKKEKY
ncbi:uncharacterized protein BO72DRAFT_118964 [Aspergillus fijiensis CBS 313.89]|uniref:Uncharacterized protein n=1 Tax=Aspergillus fijiensis CBS 313.89 TaxID=1448319 RepID=A0A8G1RMX8_9EURO|nr:uncharacterized protein BO72DRAFT_118964 [Aspergillus fijiensis CBS 313.89]RAK77017.1 hypothetical protein BO72DRAFT_118964 [Aspergillus fijiensis CBS 313.89]